MDPMRNRKLLWLLLLITAFLTIAVVAVPVWIIHPFKSQSQSGLQWSYALRWVSRGFTLAGVILSIFLCAYLWRGSKRWWQRAALVLLILPQCVSFWFARQNHFEWMFHPLPDASYIHAGQVDFIAETDMVLGVRINGEAAAYPVRFLAYHHLVQDVVGGVPIVATY